MESLLPRMHLHSKPGGDCRSRAHMQSSAPLRGCVFGGHCLAFLRPCAQKGYSCASSTDGTATARQAPNGLGGAIWACPAALCCVSLCVHLFLAHAVTWSNRSWHTIGQQQGSACGFGMQGDRHSTDMCTCRYRQLSTGQRRLHLQPPSHILAPTRRWLISWPGLYLLPAQSRLAWQQQHSRSYKVTYSG